MNAIDIAVGVNWRFFSLATLHGELLCISCTSGYYLDQVDKVCRRCAKMELMPHLLTTGYTGNVPPAPPVHIKRPLTPHAATFAPQGQNPTPSKPTLNRFVNDATMDTIPFNPRRQAVMHVHLEPGKT